MDEEWGEERGGEEEEQEEEEEGEEDEEEAAEKFLDFQHIAVWLVTGKKIDGIHRIVNIRNKGLHHIRQGLGCIRKSYRKQRGEDLNSLHLPTSEVEAYLFCNHSTFEGCPCVSGWYVLRVYLYGLLGGNIYIPHLTSHSFPSAFPSSSPCQCYQLSC